MLKKFKMVTIKNYKILNLLVLSDGFVDLAQSALRVVVFTLSDMPFTECNSGTTQKFPILS